MIVEQRLAVLENFRTPARKFRKGTRRRRKGKRVGQPRALQMSYGRVLEGFIAEFEKALREEVFSHFDVLPEPIRADSFRADSFRADSFRFDSTPADIQFLVDALRDRVRPVFSDELLQRVAEITAEKVRSKNLSQILAQLEAMGVTVGTFAAGQQILLTTDELSQLFVRTNVQLIKTLGDDLISKADTTIMRGVRSGLRHEEIRKQLMHEVGNSYSRARLIARDQVSKLNSELTRARHLEAGIVEYEWLTNIDGRERQSHADNNGKIFRYDDPPPEGNPGEEIQCRCQAIPILPKS